MLKTEPFIAKRDIIMANQLVDMAQNPRNADTHITAVVGARHKGIRAYLTAHEIGGEDYIASGKTSIDAIEASGALTDPRRAMAAESIRYLLYPKAQLKDAPLAVLRQAQSLAYTTVAGYNPNTQEFTDLLGNLGNLRAHYNASPDRQPIVSTVVQGIAMQSLAKQATQY